MTHIKQFKTYAVNDYHLKHQVCVDLFHYSAVHGQYVQFSLFCFPLRAPHTYHIHFFIYI